MSSYSSLLVITLCSLFIVTLANVPPSKTFKYINEGSFGEYSVEYFADYRVLDIVNFPFTLCFFNSTPNTFILGLRMGHRRSESIMRWVWEANRGKPVRENATLTFDDFGNGKGSLANFDFYCEPEYGENYTFELGFRINMTNSPSSGTSIFTRPKYNSTYTMFRVDMDGNLRMYTYEPNVDWGAWEVTYRLLDRDNDGKSECKLPRRCGSLGVCEDSQCVACPSPRGLIGWSKGCAPPKLPVCRGGSNVDYYKVEGVEHFTSDYNEGVGPMKISECKNRCNKDCKCVGIFYKQESSKCLVVPELGALVKVENSSHVGYIKFSK
ncbi:hypothetical protein KY290_014449 [Solanum tuberosum]|uniref:Apple domain-containing protein n=1 Tax=Solanum tuberosum TaxID=4113 RepID=A0ABQ7VPV7_SOLTU|nr:hypothetical protein KY289_014500 [Solanum tuberosum]KAH0770468.1 hypothetical protein KY290_014449 [Solanum tuberosum]